MSKDKVSPDKRGGGVPSRDALYRSVAKKADDAIKVVYELLQSRNENIRLGAAKVIMNKAIPDLKATEITGEDGGPINVRIVNDYVSEPSDSATPPNTGNGGSYPIQNAGVAQESQENFNRN